jgi:hypothetical protein
MYTYKVQWNERLYYKATVTTDMTPEDDGFDDAIYEMAMHEAEVYDGAGVEDWTIDECEEV